MRLSLLSQLNLSIGRCSLGTDSLLQSQVCTMCPPPAFPKQLHTTWIGKILFLRMFLERISGNPWHWLLKDRIEGTVFERASPVARTPRFLWSLSVTGEHLSSVPWMFHCATQTDGWHRFTTVPATMLSHNLGRSYVSTQKAREQSEFSSVYEGPKGHAPISNLNPDPTHKHFYSLNLSP
jgi:hypothetical protein